MILTFKERSKGMSSRSLLMEVVGEDLYQDFEAGLGISVESPDGYVYRFTKADNRTAHVSRRRDTTVERGEVSGKDIYDTIASFIVSVRLGKVDWRCGVVDVKLPSDMPPFPPRNLGFLTFALIKIEDGLRAGFRAGPRVGHRALEYLRRVPSLLAKLHNDLLTEEESVIYFTLFLSGVWIAIMVMVLGIIEKVVGYKWGVLMRPGIRVGIPLCLAYCIYISYRRWQRQWGGEVS